MGQNGRVHVRVRGDRWVVERDGRSAPESEHVMQDDAVREGRELAAREGVEFVLHGSGDPRPTVREETTPTPVFEPEPAEFPDAETAAGD